MLLLKKTISGAYDTYRVIFFVINLNFNIFTNVKGYQIIHHKHMSYLLNLQFSNSLEIVLLNSTYN